MRYTHSRAQRFGGHTKHSWECICGRVVSGNGGKQHFKLDGHRRLTRTEEEARRVERLAAAVSPEQATEGTDAARYRRILTQIYDGEIGFPDVEAVRQFVLTSLQADET